MRARFGKRYLFHPHGFKRYWKHQLRMGGVDSDLLDYMMGHALPFGGTYDRCARGVTPTTVYHDNFNRSLFTGWVRHSTGGYTGRDSQHLITLGAHIEEEATWKTQYYLNITSEFGNATGDGWYDEGTQAIIDVEPDEGYRFFEWRGTGPGSYTGANVNVSITLDGSITEKAVFTPLAVHELLVLSDYGETLGSGSKYEGTVANFSFASEVIQLRDKERLRALAKI